MKELAIVSLVRKLGSQKAPLPEIAPNIVESAIFQAKIHTNGRKQIRITIHTFSLNIFVCNGGHSISSKNFYDLQFSNYKIRIKKNKALLIFGEDVVYDFSKVPIESNVIYWVSWRAKNNSILKNRSDVFCLVDGGLTNKLLSPKNKANRKFNK